MDARNLPIYRETGGSQTVEVCSSVLYRRRGHNKLGKLSVPAVHANRSGLGQHPGDVHRRAGWRGHGSDLVLYASGVSGRGPRAPRTARETLTATVAAGTVHVLEVYEFSNLDPSVTANGQPRGLTCFNVQLTPL
ncbi:MAG: hypothetical protein R3E65_08375 [Steroidobacteraceae bacterium]